MVIIGTAILFIVLGALIKYGKMYFLIAGYNTMSKEEQEKYDIEGIANVFWNAMLGMGVVMVLGQIIARLLQVKDLEFGIFFITVIAGVAYLLLKTNSKKYKKG